LVGCLFFVVGGGGGGGGVHKLSVPVWSRRRQTGVHNNLSVGGHKIKTLTRSECLREATSSMCATRAHAALFQEVLRGCRKGHGCLSPWCQVALSIGLITWSVERRPTAPSERRARQCEKGRVRTAPTQQGDMKCGEGERVVRWFSHLGALVVGVGCCRCGIECRVTSTVMGPQA